MEGGTIRKTKNEADNILHCLKLFVGFVADPLSRAKNLKILRETLGALIERSKRGLS